MTPADHYAEAERILLTLDDHLIEVQAQIVAEAQVHATLATVDPNRVWPLKETGKCTCSSDPYADRVSSSLRIAPECPIHGNDLLRMEGAD